MPAGRKTASRQAADLTPACKLMIISIIMLALVEAYLMANSRINLLQVLFNP
jgi:hypothetical protein